nr:MAG TPA: hypothetical protein [Bacteriophage sp.]
MRASRIRTASTRRSKKREVSCMVVTLGRFMPRIWISASRSCSSLVMVILLI